MTRVLLEKLIMPHLVKTFFTLFGTRSFIAVFTSFSAEARDFLLSTASIPVLGPPSAFYPRIPREGGSKTNKGIIIQITYHL
jgi:hypothetical protein